MNKKLKKGSSIRIKATIKHDYLNQEEGEIWTVIGYNQTMGKKTYKLNRPSPTHIGCFQTTHWFIKDVDEMIESGLLEIIK